MTLAAVTSDNIAHGYNLTFAFPMILFIVIGGALYLIYSRPHRVPGHGALRLPAAGQAGEAPGPDAARAAATAAGFSTAAGGGALESPHEPLGAHQAATYDSASGNVSAGDEAVAGAAEPDDQAGGSADDREAGE